MPTYYSNDFLQMLRNQVPIDEVIINWLKLEVQNRPGILRFRCPRCRNFHTATNHQTNLARCFDCRENFNPIDLVMAVGNCSFVEAVEMISSKIDQ